MQGRLNKKLDIKQILRVSSLIILNERYVKLFC